jgi:hypothetical protein
MTSTDDSKDLDHAYFQALEETVIRLRETPLLLSPADWQIARKWRRKGIPLSLVTRVLEGVFQRSRSDPGVSPARSLRYCTRAVEEEWKKSEALTATGLRESPPALDLDARLGALANSLPADFPNRMSLCAEICSLAGSASEVESSLAEIDDRMMATAVESLEVEEARKVEDRAKEMLTDLTTRLPDDELRRAGKRLVKQLVRRSRGLPLLSLFSPESHSDPSD